jgi:sarcosine oxidase subunit alpha
VRRLPSGGLIDRSRPLPFRFDGRELEGFEGDTLASALLANGVDVVARSPILGRPRGVFSAGPEEPNAIVAILEPWVDVLVPATMVRLVGGLVAESRPGVGRLVDGPPPPPSTHRNVHVETLVIGAGVSGHRAALDATARGDRVLLAEQRPWIESSDGLAAAEDVTVLADTAPVGIYDDGYAVLHERRWPEPDRVWHVRAARVVLATGAQERPIAFADDDRPGVMLARAVRWYLRRTAVLPGERAVVFTTNDLAYATARALREAGGEVAAIVDVRPDGPEQRRATAEGFEVLAGGSVAGTEGDPRVTAVHLSDGRTVEADLVAVSGGWDPVTNLHRAIGGTLRYDEERSCFVPDGGPSWLSVVGAAAGEVPPSAPLWFVPAEDLSRHFVDLQRDQTVEDVRAAVGAGLRSVEHVKRATYIGTALDQGRTSTMLTAEIVNHLLGEGAGAQGPSNPRPPWTPLPFHVVAGPYRGERFDPIRTTPIHGWHVEHGARFENVGQWHRPWYYPKDGEDLEAAVLRECLAVRTGVGMQDASTLGKIEVVGPDAAVFLDRMYTNAMGALKPGRIRYGFMLGLDGMVFDDGVAMRLAEDRYLITTTTGGAARVLDHLEEWLQTEWPSLRVYLTSVTEQWSAIAVAGPSSRELLAATDLDVDTSREAMPFMAFADGTLAGAPVRICRVSFSGELAYEVWSPGMWGRHVWEALWEAGQPFGVTPYGTEAMHVLRAEKGFVIVGQDTDGTVTPYDLGMAWIVSEKKGDFVGRRSLRRADLVRPGRKQLVGLLPVDPSALIPEGAQLLAGDVRRSEGHVTSSYRSATLGTTFALAMLERGSDRHGETVVAFDGERVEATVGPPIFYDVEGSRRDG